MTNIDIRFTSGKYDMSDTGSILHVCPLCSRTVAFTDYDRPIIAGQSMIIYHDPPVRRVYTDPATGNQWIEYVNKSFVWQTRKCMACTHCETLYVKALLTGKKFLEVPKLPPADTIRVTVTDKPVRDVRMMRSKFRMSYVDTTERSLTDTLIIAVHEAHERLNLIPLNSRV